MFFNKRVLTYIRLFIIKKELKEYLKRLKEKKGWEPEYKKAQEEYEILKNSIINNQKDKK